MKFSLWASLVLVLGGLANPDLPLAVSAGKSAVAHADSKSVVDTSKAVPELTEQRQFCKTTSGAIKQASCSIFKGGKLPPVESTLRVAKSKAAVSAVHTDTKMDLPSSSGIEHMHFKRLGEAHFVPRKEALGGSTKTSPVPKATIVGHEM